MSLRRGFTLVEVLVVIGIIGVLSGIVFTLTAGAREKGRESVCASNLKSIFQAAVMYAADNPTPPLPSGFDNIMAIPPSGFRDFVRYAGDDHGLFYCPNSTAKMRTRFWSTYIISQYLLHDPSQPPAYQHSMEQQLAKLGAAFPFLKCTIHDETYYAPANGESLDEMEHGMFEIRARIDGSIKTGFFDDKRTYSFTR